jgi:hypothetical protein
MNCNYRNCDNEFEGRSNKKYCTEKCKRNEKKYRQREADYEMIEKKRIVNLLSQVEEMNKIDKDLLTLFNLINKKK